MDDRLKLAVVHDQQRPSGAKIIKTLFLVMLVAIASTSQACLWDRDTLADQAKDANDIVWVITGRFERNPPLFYEMRLVRVAEVLKQDASRLAAYDDAGVAADRLGRSDEAISWMEKKLAELERQEKSGGIAADLKEHRYRYLANIGTFHAHRWLRSGADRANLRDMEQARDYIREAIRLNPDAHFGREKYQLMAITWILIPPRTPSESAWSRGRLPTFTLGGLYSESAEADIRGLKGLVELGDAWESVDVFNALALALETNYKFQLSMMAGQRAQELVGQGKLSILQDIPTTALVAMLEYPGERETDPFLPDYTALRADADRWHENRIAYMDERLRSGRHPDTDAGFWRE